MGPLETGIISRCETFAREKLVGTHASHGWDHVERVVRNALHISSKEPGSDPFIIRVSALLHDIARPEETAGGGSSCHALIGGDMAMEFLLSCGLDEVRARHVSDCIRSHRYRNELVPATTEAKILYDADKLDSIGAVGVGRAFLFAGEVGARLHNSHVDISLTSSYSSEDTAYREYSVKLKRVKETMLTREGARLAAERHAFMEEFFSRLDGEIYGDL